jgi:sucrose phosphorylase
MQTGHASTLSQWAAALQLPSSQVTFLNFLASHDGIGLNPARGILPEIEIEAMARRVEAVGAFVSNKSNADGSQSPYEMNVNYFDALNAAETGDGVRTQVDRFVTAHAILLAFMGMPALYFHSLFGSRGWPEGVKLTQKYRTINRQKLERARVEAELAQPDSLRSEIFGRLSRLLAARSANPCFSPYASQRILEGPPSVFVLLRTAELESNAVLCLHNVSRNRARAEFDMAGTPLAAATLRDLISGRRIAGGRSIAVELAPYQAVWLTTLP